jgi:hypothetical protein
MTRTTTRWAIPITRRGVSLNRVHCQRISRKTCCGVHNCSVACTFSIQGAV